MIKVGDKVKVVDNGCGHQFNIGDIVTCIDVRSNGVADFKGPKGDSWVMVTREYDPIHETHTTGTLAEIGAQVGDVASSEHLGVEFEIKLIKDGVAHGGSFYGESSYDDVWSMHGTDDWRIVSRAKPQGPVITETVKRVVPGVYGRVKVNWADTGKVCFQLHGDHWAAAVKFSRADLIAARDVFSQLIDAMPD